MAVTTTTTAGPNLDPYANRKLSSGEWDTLKSQYGGGKDYNFGAAGFKGSGNMLGSSGYEIFHAGSGGWQLRKPGQQPAGPAQPGQPAQPTVEQQQKTAFNDALLGMMKQNPANVSINDPTLKAQMDPFRQEQDRARQMRQMAMAERLGAEGAESGGAMSSEVALSYEDMGRANAQRASELVGQEVLARREELFKALSLYGDMMTQEQQRALQLEIAKLDAQVKREATSASTSLGRDDLKLREKLGLGNLSLGLLQAQLGNDQFSKRLGFDIGRTEAEMNRDALLALMR